MPRTSFTDPEPISSNSVRAVSVGGGSEIAALKKVRRHQESGRQMLLQSSHMPVLQTSEAVFDQNTDSAYASFAANLSPPEQQPIRLSLRQARTLPQDVES